MTALASGYAEAAKIVLETADPVEKAKISRVLAQQIRDGLISTVGSADLPERPAKLDKPELVHPRDVKRRRLTSEKGRVALLHALAHIELNAINLSWDIIGRYHATEMPDAFYTDWVKVGDDESKHFLLLNERLEQFGAAYGDLPAHDGLWESAILTANNMLARLAVVPMVLEARGLDVTPDMIVKLTAIGDMETVARLQIIYDDEITHVAAGKVWFEYKAKQHGYSDLETCWQDLVKTFFKGTVKRPFNTEGRDEANFEPSYYEPLADWYEGTEFEKET